MSTDLIVRDSDTRIPVSAQGQQALERLRPKLEALAPDALCQQNVDPDVAAGRALGAVPAIMALRPRMEHVAAEADLPAIAELEDRANALLAANAHYRTTLVPPEGLVALGNEALEARTALASACAMLVSFNLLKQAQVPVLTGGHSYRIAATDTLALVDLLEASWERVQGKVPVTMEQLERLRGVGEQVVRLVNERDQMPQRANEAALLRHRALTLVDQAYDEARRVVSFLRWHEGDADEILPPLRTHVGASKHEGDDAGDAQGTGDAGGAGAAGDMAGGAGTGGAATHTLSSAEQFAEAAKVFAPPGDARTPAATSLPRSKPFSDA